jgi:hypothetical protein
MTALVADERRRRNGVPPKRPNRPTTADTIDPLTRQRKAAYNRRAVLRAAGAPEDALPPLVPVPDLPARRSQSSQGHRSRPTDALS